MNSQLGQTDLFLPLFEGILERPLWETFLQRLLARTQARQVWLCLADAIVSPHATIDRRIVAGGMTPAGDAGKVVDALHLLAGSGLRPNRVYGFRELYDNLTLNGGTGHADALHASGIGDARLIRIPANERESVWISLLHEREDFQAADSALLASLAPAIAVATRILLAIGAYCARMTVAEAALARLGIAQAIFDQQGQLIASDPSWLAKQPLQLDRESAIASAHSNLRQSNVEEFAVLPIERLGRPLIARRAGELPLPLPRQASFVASHRTPRDVDPTPSEPIVAATFGLSPRESALACRLAAGHSLAESAKLLGLTTETARNYSKKIFAKAGARGQADLVRKILSCLT